MNRKKIITGSLSIGFLALFVCSIVSATMAISKDYGDLNPVKVGPGETKEIVFGRLQNTDDKEKKMEIEVLEGNNIAYLVSPKVMTLAPQSLNNEVRFRVSIPNDVIEGTKYLITIRYKDISVSEGEGMVTIATSSQSTIPVLVEKIIEEEAKEEKSEEEWISIWWWILIIAFIIGIGWMFYKKLKESSE